MNIDRGLTSHRPRPVMAGCTLLGVLAAVMLMSALAASRTSSLLAPIKTPPVLVPPLALVRFPVPAY
jgi:hypothetical protein